MLLGRDTELEAFRSLLAQARDGRGGSLVVRGDAGVGKSLLLQTVLDEADGFRILRTQGIESESPLAFAALHRFLLPLLGDLRRLPRRQADALRGVFGLGEELPDETPGERFLVFLAALGLVTGAASEQRPVLCVVDDAHWLDDASAAALLFLARRVEVEPVAVVFGAREGGVRRFDSGELPAIVLGGLSADAADRLLVATVGAEVPAEVRSELIERTGGNPLALLEIPAALPASQLGGEAPLPAHLPLTDGLERVFLDRHDRLPDTARLFLLLAATDDSGDLAILTDAAARLGAGDDGREHAERSGLLRVADGDVQLRHPLVRSAIHGAASAVERRRVHLALADALRDRGDRDRAVWHRAAGLETPDESVAAELEEVARRAGAGGGHEAASAAWERAAALSVSDADAARRLQSAAVSAWMAGQPGPARTLAQAARSRAADPLVVADADRLRAIVEMNFGSPRVANGILLRAAEAVAAHDPLRARRMAMIGAAIAVFGHDAGTGLDPLAIAPATAAETTPHETALAALLAAMTSLGHGDLARAESEYRRALAAAEGLRFEDLLTNLPIAATQLGDDVNALRWHDAELDEARRSASPFHVLHALTRSFVPRIVAGRWGEATAAAQESLELADAVGQPGQRIFPGAALLLLAAHRGDDVTEAELAALESRSEESSAILAPIVRDALAWARGIAIARENPTTALLEFARIAHPATALAAAVDRLDAAGRADRMDLIDHIVADLDRFAAGTGAGWARAAAELGRALRADGEAAEGHYLAALAVGETSTRPFDTARIRYALGAHLRRARRRVDSREHLRVALAAFDELGARSWADRASEELRASGETVRRRSEAETPTLTPTERQVARLVAQGLGNKEVAARLFVSPRTVDFHLRNVFAKLGISSRGGLLGIPLDTA